LGGSIKPAKSLNGMVYFFDSLIPLPAVSIEDCDVDCWSKHNEPKFSSRLYSINSYGLFTANECRRDLRYPCIGRLEVIPSLVDALVVMPDWLQSTGTEMVDPMKSILPFG
jgi:hypothetical protein